MILESYETLGGRHPETSAVRNILVYHAVTAPHTGEPYSEAMLLGIGGGLGMGYILWEFAQHGVKVLTLGFRNRWQYPIRSLEKLGERVHARAEVRETSGARAAVANLRDALKGGMPAAAWVDLAGMPYLLLPAHLSGHIGHLVVVYGLDEERAVAYVDDRSVRPFVVPTAELAAARARMGSFKHRVMTFRPEPGVDLERVILEGLHDCADHLGSPSDSFSLPAIRKWARLVTDDRNTKGWRRLFADRRGLYSALRSIHEGVTPVGVSGGSLRDLYADFLDEAAQVVDRPALGEVAGRYRAVAAMWEALGESALPSEVESFGEIKRLLRERHDVYMRQGQDGLAEMRRLTDKLNSLQSGLNATFPMDDAGVDRLFDQLAEQLSAIYAAEREAHEALRTSIA